MDYEFTEIRNKKLEQPLRPMIGKKLDRAKKVYQREGLQGLVSSGTYAIERAIKKGKTRNQVRRWRLHRQGMKFSDKDPYELVHVDPRNITYSVATITDGRLKAHAFDYRKVPFGAVIDGDWDVQRTPIEELLVYRAIVERFNNKIPWAETEFYQLLIEEINQGKRPLGCESKQDLDKRCAKTEQLVETIRTEGYRTQREMGTGKPLHEIKLNVGRNGELLFNGGGRHRLAAARYLGISEIPVLILVRHSRWQCIRNAIRTGEDPPESLAEPHTIDTHPDLKDLQQRW